NARQGIATRLGCAVQWRRRGYEVRSSVETKRMPVRALQRCQRITRVRGRRRDLGGNEKNARQGIATFPTETRSHSLGCGNEKNARQGIATRRGFRRGCRWRLRVETKRMPVRALQRWSNGSRRSCRSDSVE